MLHGPGASYFLSCPSFDHFCSLFDSLPSYVRAHTHRLSWYSLSRQPPCEISSPSAKLRPSERARAPHPPMSPCQRMQLLASPLSHHFHCRKGPRSSGCLSSASWKAGHRRCCVACSDLAICACHETLTLSSATTAMFPSTRATGAYFPRRTSWAARCCACCRFHASVPLSEGVSVRFL